MMLVINSSVAMTKMTKSDGQKSWPKIENFRSTMLIRKYGLPLMRMNGPANKIASSNQLVYVRRAYQMPCGFFG